MYLNDSTPIAELTVGQLRELLKEDNGNVEQKPTQNDYASNKYAYGLKGIRELFNVSHATAQKYKDGILKDAIIQNDRKIIVDIEKALLLFSKSGRK